MCNVEFMIASSMYQMDLAEKAKKLERQAAKSAAARGLGAESLRRSQEEENLEQWFTIEGRKIVAAAGSTKVAGAGAGVQIDVLNQQWTAAHVELFGAKVASSRRSAAAGDIRKIEILEIKDARLKASEKASTLDWAMAIAQGAAMGVRMEEMTGGWDGKIFGADIGALSGSSTGPWTAPTPKSPVPSPYNIPELPGITGPRNLYRPSDTVPGLGTVSIPTQSDRDQLFGYFPDYSSQRLTGGMYTPFF